jgi:hypothetical protein
MSVTVVDPAALYETVAASQTDQVLGASGAIGDFLYGVLIQPATTTPGNVILKDGATTIWTFPGGTTTIAPLVVPLGFPSRNGAFSLTTGANVSCIAVGNFS